MKSSFSFNDFFDFQLNRVVFSHEKNGSVTDDDTSNDDENDPLVSLNSGYDRICNFIG